MAELADALDSGSSRGNPVKVQLLLAAISRDPLSDIRKKLVFFGVKQPLPDRHTFNFSIHLLFVIQAENKPSLAILQYVIFLYFDILQYIRIANN